MIYPFYAIFYHFTIAMSDCKRAYNNSPPYKGLLIVLLLKFSSSSGCPKKLGYPSYWRTPMTTWNPPCGFNEGDGYNMNSLT